MRFFLLSGVRNDILQDIDDNTVDLHTDLQSIEAEISDIKDILESSGMGNTQDQDGTFYRATLTPHSDTARWSYTVPSGKTAKVTLAGINTYRSASPSSANLAAGWYEITPSGGATTELGFVAAPFSTSLRSPSIGSTIQITLYAGDTVEYHTIDLSTGGNCYHSGSFHAVEYEVV